VAEGVREVIPENGSLVAENVFLVIACCATRYATIFLSHMILYMAVSNFPETASVK
jgi:hypothetical protein